MSGKKKKRVLWRLIQGVAIGHVSVLIFVITRIPIKSAWVKLKADYAGVILVAAVIYWVIW